MEPEGIMMGLVSIALVTFSRVCTLIGFTRAQLFKPQTKFIQNWQKHFEAFAYELKNIFTRFWSLEFQPDLSYHSSSNFTGHFLPIQEVSSTFIKAHLRPN